MDGEKSEKLKGGRAVYHKLVRDKIPDIIRGKGETAVTHIADEAEFRTKLEEKLGEEAAEYLKAVALEKEASTAGSHGGGATHPASVEELVDILEVIYALAELSGVNPEQLEVVRAEKAEKRGGFSKRIILDES